VRRRERASRRRSEASKRVAFLSFNARLRPALCLTERKGEAGKVAPRLLTNTRLHRAPIFYTLHSVTPDTAVGGARRPEAEPGETLTSPQTERKQTAQVPQRQTRDGWEKDRVPTLQSNDLLSSRKDDQGHKGNGSGEARIGHRETQRAGCGAWQGSHPHDRSKGVHTTSLV